MPGLFRRSLLLLLAAALALCLIPAHTVQAARGVPGSAEFGFGASIQPNGPLFSEALFLTNSLPLDWLAVDVSWRTLQPEQSRAGNWSALDRTMQYASQNKIPVLARLTNPPSWALSPQGPNTSEAIAFVNLLAIRYAGTLQAVELFPAANTAEGWGAVPDPFQYAALFSAVRQSLDSQGLPLLLVAAGLRPQISANSDGVSDLAFLQGLYDAGLASSMPLVGLQLIQLHGETFASPMENDPAVLRHYEQVREVMVKNGHSQGMIWITRLSFASGTIAAESSIPQNEQAQAEWLSQATVQIRSQLYIGVTIFQSLNPDLSEGNPAVESSILLRNGDYHPFYPTLKAYIQQNHPSLDKGKPGKPKDIALFKTKT